MNIVVYVECPAADISPRTRVIHPERGLLVVHEVRHHLEHTELLCQRPDQNHKRRISVRYALGELVAVDPDEDGLADVDKLLTDALTGTDYCWAPGHG